MTSCPPKVSIIGTRGYPSFYGGFETAVRKLAPYLVNTGWDVTVYGRDGAVKSDDPNRDARVRTKTTRGLETKSLSTLTYGLTAVLDVIRDKPDVALIMNVANGFWIPLLKMRGIPTLVNVDGIEWERAKWGRLAKFVFKLGARFTAKFATALISDSKEIQRRWRNEFGRESYFIPYGGDSTGDLQAVQGHDHRNYILIVARFVPENTISEFFEAAASLAHKYPVVIVGSTGYGGELDDRARQLAEENPNVTWMGHVSDDDKLHALWQHAGAYFHGHSVGGTNPALVQAMACGAPIVARDTVYNREVLAETAIFVPANSEPIAKALEQVMARSLQGTFDPTEVKKRADEFYSWDGVCGDYDEALRTHVKSAKASSSEAVERR